MGEYDQAFKHLKNAKSISDAMKWDNKHKSCHLFDMKYILNKFIYLRTFSFRNFTLLSDYHLPLLR